MTRTLIQNAILVNEGKVRKNYSIIIYTLPLMENLKTYLIILLQKNLLKPLTF